MDRRVPPGLSDGDGVETATASRERRRVAQAAKAAADQMLQVLASLLDAIVLKLDVTLASGSERFGHKQLFNLEQPVAIMEKHFATAPPGLARSEADDRSMLVDDRLKAPHIEQFEIHSCSGSADGNIDKDSEAGNHDGGSPITPRHLIADGGGGYAASWQSLPKFRRCLRAGVSDAGRGGHDTNGLARPRPVQT